MANAVVITAEDVERLLTPVEEKDPPEQIHAVQPSEIWEMNPSEPPNKCTMRRRKFVQRRAEGGGVIQIRIKGKIGGNKAPCDLWSRPSLDDAAEIRRRQEFRNMMGKVSADLDEPLVHDYRDCRTSEDLSTPAQVPCRAEAPREPGKAFTMHGISTRRGTIRAWRAI